MLEDKNVKLISTNNIIPNRFQPRQVFGEKELKELADSIKQHGIIQPLIVRQLGDKYEIIAGERRYKAALLAGLYNVPAIVVEKDDNESAEIAIIENIQRKDLTPIEEAKSYKKLIDKGLTQEEIAQKLGITQPTVANKLRLLNLTQEVQDALLHNKISERHARALLRIESQNQQINILNRIINEKINVKQTEEEIDKLLGYNQPAEDLEYPVFEKIIPEIKPINDNHEKIEILNPFTEKEEILNLDDREEKTEKLFVSNDDEQTKLNIPSNKSLEVEQINNNNNKDYKYMDIVNKAKKFIENCKSKGLKIESEEYDMDNEYQIIFRIKKEI